VSLPDQDQSSGFGSGLGGWRRRPANRVVSLIFNAFFAGVGIFCIVGGYNQWAAVQPVAGGTTTSGTVVAISNGETCGRYGCSPNWTPTIRFVTASGTAYTFVGPTSGSQMSTGQPLNVSYRPDDPNDAHDISGSGGQGLFLLGFGVFALILGLGSTILGFEALHRRTGLTSARPGSGWVGHVHLHSNQGAVAALAVLIALLVVGLFVI
jgi:uncharacterized protein DUF3592